MRSFSTLVLTLGALILTASPASASAHLDPLDVDWSGALTFGTTGGTIDPLVAVGFNPQPEPPGDGGALVDLSDPMRPSISWDTDTTTFQILFGIQGATNVDLSLMDAPDDGFFEFVVDDSRRGAFLVSLDMETDSGGVPNPASWQGFNPQPEPPVGGAGVAFGFDFTTASVATLSFSIAEFEDELTFRLIDQVAPEPSSTALITLGAVLGLLHRRRR